MINVTTISLAFDLWLRRTWTRGHVAQFVRAVLSDRRRVCAGGHAPRRTPERLAGPRHGRHRDRTGRRWVATGKIGFHGREGGGAPAAPRSLAGGEGPVAELAGGASRGWLGRWAMNLMPMMFSTRKLRRAVWLARGRSASGARRRHVEFAASRRFVALSAERMAAWMASDLSQLDFLAYPDRRPACRRRPRRRLPCSGH